MSDRTIPLLDVISTFQTCYSGEGWSYGRTHTRSTRISCTASIREHLRQLTAQSLDATEDSSVHAVSLAEKSRRQQAWITRIQGIPSASSAPTVRHTMNSTSTCRDWTMSHLMRCICLLGSDWRKAMCSGMKCLQFSNAFCDLASRNVVNELVVNDERCTREIKTRIAMAKAAFNTNKTLFIS
jgi:hypothetical protein